MHSIPPCQIVGSEDVFDPGRLGRNVFIPAVDRDAVPVDLYICKVVAGFPSPADDYVEKSLDLNECSGWARICNRYAKIFLGQDKRFLPVQDWNDYEHLGRVLAEQAEVAYSQAERDVFRCGVAKFALDVLCFIKSSTGKTDAMLKCELQAMKQNMKDILLGRIEPVKDVSELSGANIGEMKSGILQQFS